VAEDAYGRRDERCREYRETFAHPAQLGADDRSGDDERDGRGSPQCPSGGRLQPGPACAG
jgi:hypothetical protein